VAVRNCCHSQTALIASFFTDKISRLWISLTSIYPVVSQHTPSPLSTPPVSSTFRPASESEIYKILFDCPNKQSDSDPIPTWLLKKCSSVLIPTITNIVNLSLSSGTFHPILKESTISPSSRNLPWTKTNCQTIGQSLTCLLYLRLLNASSKFV